MNTKQLIPSYDHLDLNAFEDFYLAIAKNIEISLVQAGAVAGKDYTILDLYKLAQPFVLNRFEGEKSLSIAASWP